MTDYSGAACKDWPPEWWFPSHAGKPEARAAITICLTCPLREPCEREHRREMWGIWGGKYRNRSNDYRIGKTRVPTKESDHDHRTADRTG